MQELRRANTNVSAPLKDLVAHLRGPRALLMYWSGLRRAARTLLPLTVTKIEDETTDVRNCHYRRST